MLARTCQQIESSIVALKNQQTRNSIAEDEQIQDINNKQKYIISSAERVQSLVDACAQLILVGRSAEFLLYIPQSILQTKHTVGSLLIKFLKDYALKDLNPIQKGKFMFQNCVTQNFKSLLQLAYIYSGDSRRQIEDSFLNLKRLLGKRQQKDQETSIIVNEVVNQISQIKEIINNKVKCDEPALEIQHSLASSLAELVNLDKDIGLRPSSPQPSTEQSSEQNMQSTTSLQNHNSRYQNNLPKKSQSNNNQSNTSLPGSFHNIQQYQTDQMAKIQPPDQQQQEEQAPNSPSSNLTPPPPPPSPPRTSQLQIQNSSDLPTDQNQQQQNLQGGFKVKLVYSGLYFQNMPDFVKLSTVKGACGNFGKVIDFSSADKKGDFQVSFQNIAEAAKCMIHLRKQQVWGIAKNPGILVDFMEVDTENQENLANQKFSTKDVHIWAYGLQFNQLKSHCFKTLKNSQLEPKMVLSVQGPQSLDGLLLQMPSSNSLVTAFTKLHTYSIQFNQQKIKKWQSNTLKVDKDQKNLPRISSANKLDNTQSQQNNCATTPLYSQEVSPPHLVQLQNSQQQQVSQQPQLEQQQVQQQPQNQLQAIPLNTISQSGSLMPQQIQTSGTQITNGPFSQFRNQQSLPLQSPASMHMQLPNQSLPINQSQNPLTLSQASIASLPPHLQGKNANSRSNLSPSRSHLKNRQDKKSSIITVGNIQTQQQLQDVIKIAQSVGSIYTVDQNNLVAKRELRLTMNSMEQATNCKIIFDNIQSFPGNQILQSVIMQQGSESVVNYQDSQNLANKNFDQNLNSEQGLYDPRLGRQSLQFQAAYHQQQILKRQRSLEEREQNIQQAKKRAREMEAQSPQIQTKAQTVSPMDVTQGEEILNTKSSPANLEPNQQIKVDEQQQNGSQKQLTVELQPQNSVEHTNFDYIQWKNISAFEQGNNKLEWEGFLSKSNSRICAFKGVRYKAVKWENPNIDFELPYSVDVSQRSDFNYLFQVHMRKIQTQHKILYKIMAADSNYQNKLRDFSQYLQNKKRAGVVQSSGVGFLQDSTIYLMPPMQEVLKSLNIEAEDPPYLLCLIVPALK